MRITVFGASGRTGQPLVERALDRGHEVVAFVRSRAKLPFDEAETEGLTVVIGDAYEGTGVDEAVADADVVVSVMGQTDAGPDDLLTVAGDRILAAMDDRGVERFVALVGAGVREEGESVSLGGRLMGALLKLLAREALEDAAAHVESVTASDTRWTVVRAPRLTEDDPRGEYRHGTDLQPGMAGLARADLAEFILDVVEEDLYVREMPKISN